MIAGLRPPFRDRLQYSRRGSYEVDVSGDCYLHPSLRVGRYAEGLVRHGEYRTAVGDAVHIPLALGIHDHPRSAIPDIRDLHPQESRAFAVVECPDMIRQGIG